MKNGLSFLRNTNVFRSAMSRYMFTATISDLFVSNLSEIDTVAVFIVYKIYSPSYIEINTVGMWI